MSRGNSVVMDDVVHGESLRNASEYLDVGCDAVGWYPSDGSGCLMCPDYVDEISNLSKQLSGFANFKEDTQLSVDLRKQLINVSRERDVLKDSLKKQKEKLAWAKSVEAENEALREAMKQKHPTSLFALLSGIAHQSTPEIVTELENRIEAIKQYYEMKLKKHAPVLCKSSNCIVLDSSELSVAEWIDIVRACIDTRNVITSSLTEADIVGEGLLSRSSFRRCTGPFISGPSIERLTDIYAYGENEVDYKTFLADIATRAGVFTTDLETENRTLRLHIDSLINELSEKMEVIENEELLETLQIANDELIRKEFEIQRYKGATITNTKDKFS